MQDVFLGGWVSIICNCGTRQSRPHPSWWGKGFGDMMAEVEGIRAISEVGGGIVGRARRKSVHVYSSMCSGCFPIKSAQGGHQVHQREVWP